MVFSTHAVVGGAIASAVGANVPTAFAIGLLSHYLLDKVPHWDYPLASGTKTTTENPLDGDIVIGKAFLIDLCKIIPDFFLGFFLALHFFSFADYSSLEGLSKIFYDPVFWGALGAIVPDGLQFLYFKIRREPLITLQKFHDFMHTPYRLSNWHILGPIFQILLITLCIALFRV
jgi:hypothetical protein